MTARDQVSHWVKTHRIPSFYVLALGLSWVGWIPYAAAQAGYLRITIPFEVPILTQFGPSIAAFALTFFELRGRGVKDLFRQLLRWRIGFRWYAIALLLTPAIAVAILLLHNAFGGRVPGLTEFGNWYVLYAERFGSGGGPYSLEKSALPSMGVHDFFGEAAARGPWHSLVVFLFFAITTGPLSEEFGWRGFVLPRLQMRYTPLAASLLVGLMWGFWHTGPDFWRLLLSGNLGAFLYPLAITGGTLPLSILFAWIYNKTGSSLIGPMLCHGSFNSTLYLLTLVWAGRSAFWIGVELVVGLWLVAVAVVILGKLGRSSPAFA